MPGELSVSTSDYAQTFFKSEEKDKCRKGGERGSSQQVRVRQVAVNSDNGYPPSGYHQQGSNIARKAELRDLKGTLTDAFSKYSLLNHLLFVLSVTMRKVGIFS